MPSPTLIIASHNPAKRREFEQLLGHVGVSLLDLAGFARAPRVAEEGDTYLANARLKALTIARFTHLPALADDSGLEVDALGGAPGVRSARFGSDVRAQESGHGNSVFGGEKADHDNIVVLLDRLRNVPDSERTARFRCVIVVAHPDGRELCGEGTCEGMITRTPRGAGGFGYDPVFYYPPAGATFAQMSGVDKDRVSHRAEALRSLRSGLLSFLTGAA